MGWRGQPRWPTACKIFVGGLLSIRKTASMPVSSGSTLPLHILSTRGLLAVALEPMVAQRGTRRDLVTHSIIKFAASPAAPEPDLRQ